MRVALCVVTSPAAFHDLGAPQLLALPYAHQI
jgi:hypothetical protein